MIDMIKKCYILRGLPGSGKTTTVPSLFEEEHYEVCSADDFFMDDGVYRFNPKLLHMAHEECFWKFCAAINGGLHVAVDNTNIRLWEISPYLTYAHVVGGYDVTIVEVHADVETCIERNIHGVPAKVINRMKANWEYIPQYWKCNITFSKTFKA